MMKDILMLIGIVTVSFCIISVIALLYGGAKELIKELKYRYKYKHRFDIKPIAKCYCHDCRLWNPETGECSDRCNSRRMADNWFCCFAEPVSREILNIRENAEENTDEDI